MSEMSDVDSNAVHHPMSIGTATCFVQQNGRAHNALGKGAEKKRCILAIANVMLVPAQEQVWTWALVNMNGLGTCSNVEMCLNVSARN